MRTDLSIFGGRVVLGPSDLRADMSCIRFFNFRIFFNESPTEARDFEDNSGQVDVLVIAYIWVMTLYIHDETRYLFFSFHIPFAHSNFSFQVPIHSLTQALVSFKKYMPPPLPY